MKKDAAIYIRISSEDKAKIWELAKAAGKDLSAYLIECALSGTKEAG